MKIAMVVVMAAMAAGCGLQKEVPATETTKPVEVREYKLTDDQKIALLRAEAHKRGLRWHIWCVDSEFGKFIGSIKPKAVPEGALYVEEGAEPYWSEFGDTQADVAFDLYQEIQGEPNMHPDHRPDYTADKHHKLCPPELRGE